VRAAISRGDLAAAEALVEKFRTDAGNTPEALEASSWLGRGALAAEDFARATRYAEQTEALALDALKSRALDAEPHLPTALGAAIETEAKAMVATGQRAGADPPSAGPAEAVSERLDSGSPPEEHSSAQPRRQAGASVHRDGVPRRIDATRTLHQSGRRGWNKRARVAVAGRRYIVILSLANT